MSTSGRHSLAPGTTSAGGSEPDSPTDLDRHALLATVKRAGKQFGDDNVADLAAGLTYHAVLSIFPGFIVLVSIFGLLGRNTAERAADQATQLAPGGVGSFVNSIIDQAQRSSGTAGFTAVIGLVVALWTASGYVAAFMRAANDVYDVGEGRPVVKKLALRLGITVLTLVLLTVGSFIVVVSGPVASSLGELVGAGSAAVTTWNIVKWPVLLLIVAVILAVLYWAAPNAEQGGVRWVSPGGVVAVLLWVAASGLFALYLAFFASYNKTYGSLAAVIIFLIWLWITNIAILFGLEINAELDHQRAMAGGLPERLDGFAVPRDTDAFDDDARAEAERITAARHGARSGTDGDRARSDG